MVFDAAVFAGGPHGAANAQSFTASFVVAADGGLHLAARHGLVPDVVLGDLDSVDAGELARARAAGVEVVRHPVDKDRTDLELALDRVAAEGHRRVLVIGSDGGRLDHLLGSVGLLAAERFAHLEIEAVLGGQRVVPIRGRRTITGRIGDHLSLLAWHGPAKGVTASGLRWPLDEHTLDAGTSLGISNEFMAPEATVTVREGCVVAVVPTPDGVSEAGR